MRINDNGIDREMNENELSKHNENIARIKEDEIKELEAIEIIVASKKSACAKLGLTADEVAALFG